MTESEISAALRTKRMDALNKKVDGSDFISGDPTDIIRRKFDIPDADTQMLEAVAHGLLDDFLQKIKVSTAAPRTDAQMDGQIEVDFGDGVETFNAIKPAKHPKHGIITDNRYIKKSSRGGVHFKPPLRRTPVDKCLEGCCNAAIKWDFQNHMFSQNDGVWTRVDTDYGFIPCNTKCDRESPQFCTTHLKCKKSVVEWIGNLGALDNYEVQ